MSVTSCEEGSKKYFTVVSLPQCLFSVARFGRRRWPRVPASLHLGLDLLEESLEFIHVRLLLRPADAQPLLLVGFGNLRLWQSGQILTLRNTKSPLGLSWPRYIPCGSGPVALVSSRIQLAGWTADLHGQLLGARPVRCSGGYCTLPHLSRWRASWQRAMGYEVLN